jgi:hypothetical protein
MIEHSQRPLRGQRSVVVETIVGEAGVSIRGFAAFTGDGRDVVHVLLDNDAVARCRAALERAGIGIAGGCEVLVVDIEDRPWPSAS